MKIKDKLVEVHLDMLNDKIDVFQGMIDSMTADAQNDAKSSAGDKHETALAMMHLEQDNLRKKVNEAIDQRAIVSRIDTERKSEFIEFGSFVRINSIYLFFSAALPKVFIDEFAVLAISMDAPLAKALVGRRLYDEVTYNGSVFTIFELE